LIAQLEQIATAGLQPDLTLWLDLPLAEATRRRGERQGAAAAQPDRIEAAGEAFLARVQQGFAAQALQRGWQRIAADQSPEQVGAACRQALQQRFGA
jgi:dTMP kinase